MSNRTRKSGETKRMSDVAMARDYVGLIGGAPGKGNAIIAAAHAWLTKLFPHEEEPKWQWTQRRVRSFWERDAALVEYREMVELHHTAEHVKAERILIEAARKEHAAFIAKTASLRALLEHQDEAFHRPSIEGLGSVIGRVDLPRADGDVSQ